MFRSKTRSFFRFEASSSESPLALVPGNMVWYCSDKPCTISWHFWRNSSEQPVGSSSFSILCRLIRSSRVSVGLGGLSHADRSGGWADISSFKLAPTCSQADSGGPFSGMFSNSFPSSPSRGPRRLALPAGARGALTVTELTPGCDKRFRSNCASPWYVSKSVSLKSPPSCM